MECISTVFHFPPALTSSGVQVAGTRTGRSGCVPSRWNASSATWRGGYNLQSKKVDGIGGQQGDYGHERLGSTVADFCDRWELGVENLAKDGQEVANRLSKSVQAYLHVDNALKGHMDEILQRSSGEDPGVK